MEDFLRRKLVEWEAKVAETDDNVELDKERGLIKMLAIQYRGECETLEPFGQGPIVNVTFTHDYLKGFYDGVNKCKS